MKESRDLKNRELRFKYAKTEEKKESSTQVGSFFDKAISIN